MSHTNTQNRLRTLIAFHTRNNRADDTKESGTGLMTLIVHTRGNGRALYDRGCSIIGLMILNLFEGFYLFELACSRHYRRDPALCDPGDEGDRVSRGSKIQRRVFPRLAFRFWKFPSLKIYIWVIPNTLKYDFQLTLGQCEFVWVSQRTLPQ